MRHDISRTGSGFSLRPVTVDDAPAIVHLRTDPKRAAFLHPTSASVDDQIAWTHRYFEREGDWYFVIENAITGAFEGAIAVYNHDPVAKTAEMGRWITQPGSMAALESAALSFDIGFDEIQLDMIYTRTEAVNGPVISFLDTLGSKTKGPVVGPNEEHWIEQRMTKDEWKERRPQLQPMIDRIAITLRKAQ
jgi:RimJ/RimL family protein N-acetyltransferase